MPDPGSGNPFPPGAAGSPGANPPGAPNSGASTATLPLEREDATSTNSAAQAKGDKEKTPSSEDIQVSFQGANIDMIVQWLAQTTGKSVVKHPRVQCQLTIVGSKKVSPREAVTLVYRALALEGYTVIESSKSILIVPEGQEPKMSPQPVSSAQTEIPEGRQRLLKVFPLKHVQAFDVKDKVKTVLSDKATVEADEHANQLIVTDYNDNLVLLEQFINSLDTDKPVDVTIRLIPLKNASAVQLAKEIGPLYQKITGKSTKDTIEVTANERSNSLIVLSSEANFTALQQIVTSLDTEDAQEKIMQVFQLKNADAQDVAKQLQDLYQEEDNSNRYPFFYFGPSNESKNTKKMSVVADRRRNTLIIQAVPAAMEGIGKMIAALDEPVNDESLAPKIFPLKYVSAGDIEDLLNELFLKKGQSRGYWDMFGNYTPPNTVDRDVGRLYGKVRITSEPYSNAIIVTSNSAESLAAVEEILKQLDVPSQAGETSFRVSLKFAQATTVANSLNILFAKGGSPPLRPVNQNNQPNGQNPQQQQQQQNGSYQNNFDLEQETKEEGYFPWLGGQPENPRLPDGRNVRQASDLVGRVRVVADQRSNSLLISANVHFFPQVMKLIEELDEPTAQVLIEARIVEVSSDFLDKLGVRWSPDGTKVFTADDYDNSLLAHLNNQYQKGFGGLTSVNSPSSASLPAVLTQLRSGVLDSTISMDYLIQFLRTTTAATVLAEPQINIKDNETGRLFVGQQVPILDNSIVTQVGGQTTAFKYKDVGVILEVTPHLNTSGDVALKIHAESSTIVAGQTVLGGAVFNSRNFKTDVKAKSGQTLVLGGIHQKQVSDTLRKTPILGDIPGLGWLFKKRDKTTQEVELLVFLRPKVVRTPEEAQDLLDDVKKHAPLIKEWQDESNPQ